MWSYLAIGLSSLAVGFLGSVAGFGGGILIVPLLTLAFGYEVHLAIGSNMLGLIPAALIAAIAYLRQGLVDPRLALLLLIPTLGTTYLGAWVAAHLSAASLKPFFGVLLLLLSLRILRRALGSTRTGPIARALRRLNSLPPVHRRDARDAQGNPLRYEASMPFAVVLGSIAGFAAGLFGVGGGFLTTPVMVLAFGVPVRVAVACSMTMIVVSASVGSVSHYALGHVLLPVAVATGVGLSLGALIGPRVSLRLRERTVELLLAAVLFVVGVAMAVAGVQSWF